MDYMLKYLMPSTVKIAPMASKDAYSKHTYGSDTSIQCNIAGEITLVKDSKGVESVSKTQIILATVNGTTVDSRVTLPDNTTPRILTVKTFQDHTGNVVEQIFLE
jgi:hypothetical protein